MSGAIKPLALSLGDPAGIGPELICAAWTVRKRKALPAFVICGGAEVLKAASRWLGMDVPVRRIASVAEAASAFAAALPVIGAEDCEYRPGEPDRESAKVAFASLEAATDLVVLGEASALVTGPVAKSRLVEIGFAHPGQTEFLGCACGVASGDAVMMLAGPSLRTVPLTVHCALADVPGLLTPDLILHRARIVARALHNDFGIAKPRLAVAGLNPHAGEDGKFGDEEALIIAPAIAELRAEGIDATGPHPADALFTPRARPGYDAALCMYHDQALIPLKALEFDAGVNVTLGLPIIRTSADHGTAFDIAGKGVADPGATIAAIRIAGEMAMRRAKTDGSRVT